MKPKLADFEMKILEFMCKEHIDSSLLSEILTTGPSLIEYSSSGYYLTFKHKSLPLHRKVISEPVYLALYNEISIGFVVFIEKNELVLECHSWGGEPIHKSIRDEPFTIKTKTELFFPIRPCG